jgi:hypothetical protein
MHVGGIVKEVEFHHMELEPWQWNRGAADWSCGNVQDLED